MAMSVHPHLIGVDVSKAELMICQAPEQPLESLDNEPKAIRRWLRTLPKGSACFAVEATNTFHLELIEQAHRRGHTVYLIDGYRLNRYRESVGGRAKTDAKDARLLWRYLSRERDDLRAWEPPAEGYRSLQQLLRRRASLVRAKIALQQSLSGLPELKRWTSNLMRQLEKIDAELQRRLRQVAQENGWSDQVNRCQAIEGIGPITAAALTMAFHRGRFRGGDAFVAFLGLDVRVRDSGTMKGRRKLTKQGDPEVRRLLHLAAMRACRTAAWAPFYQRYLERRFTRIQALTALARKLARVAFALMKNQSEYQPKLV